MYQKPLTIFCLLCLLSQCLPAQRLAVFETYGRAQGLPSHYVFDAEEDEQGYLWLGTDKGLCRYDGYHWRTWTTDHGLPGNYINRVLSDGHGGLWLVVGGKGIFHWKPSGSAPLQVMAAGYLMQPIQCDSSGNLFVFSLGLQQLFRFGWQQPNQRQLVLDFREGQVRHVGLAPDSRRLYLSAPPEHPTNVYVAPGWQVVSAALPLRHAWVPHNRRVWYDLKGLYLRHTRCGQYLNLYGNGNSYHHLADDGRNIYSANELNGLTVIGPNGHPTNFTTEDGLPSNRVTDILVMRNGRIIIATLGGGICQPMAPGTACLPTGGQPVTHLATDGTNYLAYTEGRLLTGDLSMQGSATSHPLAAESVQHLLAHGGRIFICTLKGLEVYRLQQGRLRQTDFKPEGAGISAIIPYDGAYLAGTYGGGLLRYDADRAILTPVPGGMPVVEKLFAIPGGFAESNLDDGLRLHRAGRPVVSLQVKNGLPSNAVYGIQAAADTLWISTAGGLATYARGQLLADALPGSDRSPFVASFYDSSGRQWVVTDRLLYRRTTPQQAMPPVYISQRLRIGSALFLPEKDLLLLGAAQGMYVHRLSAMQSMEPGGQKALQLASAGQQLLPKHKDIAFPAGSSLHFVCRPADASPFSETTLYYQLEGWQRMAVALRDSPAIAIPALPPGKYRLLLQTGTAMQPYGPAVTVASFSIHPPFWQRWWFVGLVSLGLAAGSLLALAFWRKRRQRREQAARQLEHTLAEERERIAKDLHDHLGSALVTMIAQADNVEARVMRHQHEEALEKISQLASQSRETMNVLRETIWAVQENSHSLQEFVLRIRSLVQRMLDDTGIRWEVTLQGDQAAVNLTPNQSLQLFRLVQEATQNIMKHAGATAASYAFTHQPGRLMLTIADNGKGINGQGARGNGMANMERRMKALQGDFSLSSGQGTTIQATIPI